MVVPLARRGAGSSPSQHRGPPARRRHRALARTRQHAGEDARVLRERPAPRPARGGPAGAGSWATTTSGRATAPEDGLDDNLGYVREGWQIELINISHDAFHAQTTLEKSHVMAPGGRGDVQLDTLVDYTLVLLEHRVVHIFPEVFAHPGASLECLHEDPDVKREALQRLLREWHALLRLEAVSLINRDSATLLSCIAFRDWSAVRLLFHLNEAEGADPHGPATRRALVGMHLSWPDEKGGEDTHQFLRDESRRRRYAKLTPLRMQRAAIEADIIGKRGMDNRATVSCNEVGSAPTSTLLEQALLPCDTCR